MMGIRFVRYTVITLLLISSGWLSGCWTDETVETNYNSDKEGFLDQSAEVLSDNSSKTQCILVNYLAEKPELLQEAFIGGESELKAHQMKLLRSFKSIEDPISVFFLIEIDNYDLAEKLLKSREFNETLSRSRIINRPTVVHYNGLQYQNQIMTDSTTNYLIVSHPVEDVKHWKKVFNASNDARKRKGINMIRVFSAYEDDNNITMLFTVTHMDSITSYFNSPGLHSIIGESGVSSAPDIKFFNRI